MSMMDIPSPLHSSEEQDHTADRQESTHVIDLREYLLAAESLGVNTRWGKVEDGGHDKTDESPQGAEETNPAPRRVVGD